MTRTEAAIVIDPPDDGPLLASHLAVLAELGFRHTTAGALVP